MGDLVKTGGSGLVGLPYDKLTYNDILHNQAAYERFDSVGKELFTKTSHT